MRGFFFEEIEVKMVNQKLMSPEEFESQVHKLGDLKANTVELARLILVDGKTKAEAARITKITPQNVSKKMQRVQAVLSGFPPDWVLVKEMMPESMATEIRAKLKELRLAFKNS
jgi:hypothetical protein